MKARQVLIIITLLVSAALVAPLPTGAEEAADVSRQEAEVEKAAKRFRELHLKMMDDIQRREKELDLREEEIRVKEENLRALEKEFSATLKKLIALEKKLDREEEERLMKLAKVFESSPPEQGGKLLSELDAETAAKVLQRMNSRKAGRLWAFVDPDKAAKISEILTEDKKNP